MKNQKSKYRQSDNITVEDFNSGMDVILNPQMVKINIGSEISHEVGLVLFDEDKTLLSGVTLDLESTEKLIETLQRLKLQIWGSVTSMKHIQN